ncbi:hypothetical protein Ahy_A03g011045 [Arachis hypogaea]|uniref:Bet v I/Major latex protein domain-containing protein n=1 Tax=Arachis hypogaea TaxID=3818 RepID=A0A445DPE1_ARAHY|nr:hypothetical protein Ahy_A03g011045 [Arachis hypogaea]
MAGVVGKLEAEIEVKSNADKFWNAIRDFATILPKVSPSVYKSIHIIQGDAKVPGSIIKYTLDMGNEVVTVTERIEDVDDAKRTLIYSVIDGDLLKYFKSNYKGYISVTPKGDDNGSIVKWSAEFEKVSQEVPEPIFIKEFATKIVGKLEAETEVKSNADKFWGAIRDFVTIFPKASPTDYKSIQILEGDGKVVGSVYTTISGDQGNEAVKTVTEKIESVDDAKRTIIYSVIDGDLLKYYKRYKGYVNVTPKGDDNGSLVKWSCEYEKASQDVPEPNFMAEAAINTFLKVDHYILNA